MEVKVKKVKRNKNVGDPNSPQLYYLERVPGMARTNTLEDIAQEVELIGAMSAEDVLHVLRSAARQMKGILAKGDKIKINGLGLFYTTFSCHGSQTEEECTVRNIHKVNVRFRVDNTLRLVNDSTAPTRGTNNMKFAIKGETTASGGNNPGDDDDWEDPNA